jgi:hypothetical protein
LKKKAKSGHVSKKEDEREFDRFFSFFLEVHLWQRVLMNAISFHYSIESVFVFGQVFMADYSLDVGFHTIFH